MIRAGMNCPFVAKGKINDPRCFVGRREELRLLADRMSGSRPVSLNIVGGRLTGKSSLLQHFTSTWAQRGPDPNRFLVVFICLRLTKPATEAEFYQTLAKALRDKLPDLPACSGSSREFQELLDKLAERGLLPVFCLDEFEKLFDHLEELNKDFYDRLRGLMNSNRLMLIIASRERLKVYGEEHQLQSAFFNLGQLCELKDFSDEEADELLRLPLSGPPALRRHERQLARNWGGRIPWQLQLAASFLFEARQNGKDHAWAKQQFKLERGRLLRMPQPQRSFSLRPYLRAALVDFPRWLGRLPLRLGQMVDNTRNWIIGAIIILLFLAWLFKYAGIADLFSFVRAKIKP